MQIVNLILESDNNNTHLLVTILYFWFVCVGKYPDLDFRNLAVEKYLPTWL